MPSLSPNADNQGLLTETLILHPSPPGRPELYAKQEHNHHLQSAVAKSFKGLLREAARLHQFIKYLLTKIPGQQREIKIPAHVLKLTPKKSVKNSHFFRQQTNKAVIPPRGLWPRTAP
jgi:hypothetical protein